MQGMATSHNFAKRHFRESTFEKNKLKNIFQKLHNWSLARNPGPSSEAKAVNNRHQRPSVTEI
jgi:hypothetical protein